MGVMAYVKARITGIRGLASTAKVDDRWVRGNAGVLLQLLECRESSSIGFS